MGEMDSRTEAMFALCLQVRAVLMDSDEHEAHEFSCREERLYSEAELDLRDRGFVYGLAYGFARAENPEAPIEHVRELAYDAAEEAWRGWNARPTRREIREAEHKAVAV
jgi:hypothetical protein